MDVLIDTDPGMGTLGCDPEDSLAITMALASPEVTVRAITCVHGNVPVRHSYANAAHLLDLLGRTDVPLAAGAERPLLGARRREPLRWLAQQDARERVLPAARRPYAEPRAVELIHRTARDSDGLTIIAIGPLTNLAAALVADPALADRLAQVTVMGGAFAVPGNITPTAEFNFFMDPEAAQTSPACGPCSSGSTSATGRTSRAGRSLPAAWTPSSAGSCGAHAHRGCRPRTLPTTKARTSTTRSRWPACSGPSCSRSSRRSSGSRRRAKRCRAPAQRGCRAGRRRGRGRTAATTRSWPPASTSPASTRCSSSACWRDSEAPRAGFEQRPARVSNLPDPPDLPADLPAEPRPRRRWSSPRCSSRPAFQAFAWQAYSADVPLKRHRVGMAFALCAVLAILALFVLHGIAAGVAALATMLAFILACITALGRQDGDTDRTGVAGWVGHWF